MARPIVLSNGKLHVGINNYGLVHDFYYPYVGLENHSAGKNLRHKVGVWIDGQLSWLDDGSWEISFRTSDKALIGHTKAKHSGLNVVLEFDDFVDSEDTIFYRNIHIVNLADRPREIRLFTHQAFAIGDSRSNTDTAQYVPSSDAILHYRGRRAFVVSSRTQSGDPFDQHAIGLFGIEGRAGTFCDAEDGELGGNNVEHGRVDSTLRHKLQVPAFNSARVHYWIAAATSTDDALKLHKQLLTENSDQRLHDTAAWWEAWLAPTVAAAERLPKDVATEFIKSAMVIKSHTDRHGAVIASTDTGMLNYSRDAYGYCWPRDGAHVLWPLIRMGYEEEALNFFAFCQRVLDHHGYLMHKYRADGALGSSWHPYVHGDLTAPPIQEDETALVVFVFSQFYHMHEDKELLDRFYDTLIKPMATFMSSYIDETTHLPKPTYDLWEEVFLTSTYTTALTQAALSAAAELAEIKGDSKNAVTWRSAAEDMRTAAQKYLYNDQLKRLRKGILSRHGEVSYDDTLDTSGFYGAFMFGLFDSTSEELKNTHAAILEILASDNGIRWPRYERDSYRRSSDTAPPNPWFICSLWQAQYYTEIGNVDKAWETIRWVVSSASDTGMLSEQIDPFSFEPVSVSPLVWTHAELLSTLLDTLPGERK